MTLTLYGILLSMSVVQVELPEELFALANVNGTPSRSASKLIALGLFRERREVLMHYTETDWEQAVARKLKL
jgi:hypothetical protein